MSSQSRAACALACFVLSTSIAACAADEQSAESLSGVEAADPSFLAPHESPWQYSMTLPFHQLSTEGQAAYRDAIPVDGVGAVKTKDAPFRATATYLGTHEGIALFGIAEHVALNGKAFAVEFGHASKDGKFEVPVEEQPLFSSVPGDFAILRAKADLSAEVTARLATTPIVRLSFADVAELEQRPERASYMIIGRASHPTALSDIKEFSSLWTEDAAAAWAAASKEAAENLDERADETKRQGDVLAVAPTNIVAGGHAKALLDPDGLTIGSEVEKPFLKARPGWAPESYAFTYRSIGRLSGGPVFRVTRDGARVVAVHWTKGVPQDLAPVLEEVKTDPKRAFGIVTPTTASDGTPKLKLEQTAPFAYASTLKRAGADLRAHLESPPADLDAAERGALEALVRDATAPYAQPSATGQ